jgi:thioredoxin-like negative regulator of GroEL
MQVEDIITDWLDDNGPELVRDEIDVEREIEIQVETALNEIDLDAKVDEAVKDEVAKLCDQSEFSNKMVELDVQTGRVDDLQDRLSELSARCEQFQRDLVNLQCQINTLNNRGFWERLFG